MQTRMIPAMLALAAGSTAAAQTLQWTQRVHEEDGDHHHVEVAVAVSRWSPDVVVAWMQVGDDLSSYVLYNVSVDGQGFVQGNASTLPVEGNLEEQVDPMVGFSRLDGTLWVGSCQQFLGFQVAVKEAQSQTANTAVLVEFPPNERTDKGLLAVGPEFGGGAEHIYLAFTRETTRRMAAAMSDTAGETWDEDFPVGPDQGGNVGFGAAPVVLHDGTEEGRLVVAFNPHDTPAGSPLSLPKSVWTSNGTNWTTSTGLTHAVIPTTDPSLTPPEEILPFSPAIFPFRIVSFPSISVDPGDANRVYVVFSGIPESSPPENNIDIFVAQSLDGGASFSGARILRLRDIDLGEEIDKHQLMPAVSVDPHGGVNIVYYSAWKEITSGFDEEPDPEEPEDPEPEAVVWHFQAKYARIDAFGTYPHPDVESLDLADPFTFEGMVIDQDFGMGHYVMIDSRQCEAYAAFMSRDTNDRLAMYVSRVLLDNEGQCSACGGYSANCDESTTEPVLNVADFTCFLQKFAQNDPYANCDGSTTAPVVNVADFTCFLQKFAMGCDQRFIASDFATTVAPSGRSGIAAEA